MSESQKLEPIAAYADFVIDSPPTTLEGKSEVSLMAVRASKFPPESERPDKKTNESKTCD